MAVAASFHQNVLLLNQLVPPNDEFKKYFREGMFDKPNIAGFIQVSHYLLTIYDAERFQKLIEWPITCKKTEAKYRNDVRDYLNVLALENPEIKLPRVLTTYLHHSSGTKFILVMWKLSQLVLRSYIVREGDYEVAFAPKLGPTSDLTRTYLQQAKADVARNATSRHRNYLQMEKALTLASEEEKEELAKIKTKLFDEKQSMEKHVAMAPVAASIKQRLLNIDDSDVIQMWVGSLDKNMSYIKKQHAKLSDLEKICENVNGIISNLSSDANRALDGKQLQEIHYSRLLELPLSPEIQSCLYHLYEDNRLMYHNFNHLFALIIAQVYQWLRKNQLVDLSPCLLQMEASIEDIKSARNIFKTFLTSLGDTMKETQSVSCERNNAEHLSGTNVLPLVKSVLLMPSPLIKIDTNCADEKNDLHELLQFTPGEVAHKSLFSKYSRNCTPNLRTNLFVSRINFDDSILLNSTNEKPSTNMRFVTPKVDQLYKRSVGKYSRLFTTYKNNTKASCSMVSLPFNARANSAIAAGEIPNLSDLHLDITAKGFFNLNEEFLSTPIQRTPVKRDTSKKASEETRNNVQDREFNVSKPQLDELTEVQFVDSNNGTVLKHKNASRRSISDLMERYKKLLVDSNKTTEESQNECME